MLTYLLFVALTNLAMGIVLGYFYGPLFWPSATTPVPVGTPDQPFSQVLDGERVASSITPGPDSTDGSPEATPLAPEHAEGDALPSDDLRPAKQTGSREVTALDLADVMSELGLDPAAPPEPAPGAALVAS